MIPPGAGVSVRTLRPVLDEVARQDEDPNEVLSRVGLDRAIIDDPDARVPHDVAVRTWLAAQEVTADPFFGLNVASHADLGAFDVQSHAFFSSPDLRTAIGRVVAYQRLNHSAATIELVVEGDRATLQHDLPGDVVLPVCISEWLLGTWLRWSREGTGRFLKPLAARFRHGRPSLAPHLDELRDTFDVEPTFDAEHNALVLPAGYLALPMVAANASLLGVLDRHAHDLLAKLPEVHTFRDQVRQALTGELPDGNPSAEHIAELVGLSVSTLSRRLRDEGTSHKEELAGVRQELASRYLADERIGITEVAFLLGFSENSAFTRAFKRWTGMTPSEYRARSRA